MRRTVPLLLFALILYTCGCATCQNRKFDFALIGDVPYVPEQVTNSFPNLIRSLNRERLDFVVHDGDIKGGATPCDDAVYEDRLRDFNSFEHPFILLFGDNEWSDCGKTKEPRDPEERLGKLREMFATGDQSLGKRKLSLNRQSSEYRENIRWTAGGVLFVGINVPGGINNYGTPEFRRRNEANLSWLKDSFAVAGKQNCRAVMLIWQANPFPEKGSTNRVHAGFRATLALLEAETLKFARPVVLVHGDSHYFRIDKPLTGTRSKRRIENFTRVETFGNPDVHWIRVTVDPRDPEVFTFRPRIIDANRVLH